MNVQDQIAGYIAGLPEPKREEIEALHRRIVGLAPNARLWFLDGRNDDGKIVANPNIGYGAYTVRYASGATREFFRIGLSANTTGISVYVMGLEDKTYLARTYGPKLGKAKVTGYCVKFRSLKDIDPTVLDDMIASHLMAEVV
jgi:hypothetical protein